ncbi:MAG: N-acetylmuramoyl-L-alanine amidase-like domain-containing protein [Vulcanimicrobiota bacterium]
MKIKHLLLISAAITGIFISLLICSSFPVGCAEAPKLYTIKDRAKIDSILADVHSQYRSIEERMKALALMRVGTPYSGGCLGEEKPPDEGPLFRTDETDCTVFILTNCAMAHQKSYREARNMMKLINYYNPPRVGREVVSYNNRIHFTYERLHQSPYFRDISLELLPSSQCAKITLTLNRKSDGGKLLDIPWEKKVTAFYIPSSAINAELLSKLPAACGVGFVRKKSFKLGIVVSHEGMIVDRKYLIHANSILGRVEKTDFMNYYFTANPGYFDGILISRFL